jgi:hypothetical protein
LAATVSARLSRSEGRKFGLTVGAAFLVLGALLWWRGRAAAPAFAGVGALLSMAGLLIPAHLGPLERAWMGLAHAISRVTTPILMGAIYFLVITPIGMLMRALGRNPMRARASSSNYWVARPPSDQASDMQRQF